jgi:hypothetical protein
VKFDWQSGRSVRVESGWVRVESGRVRVESGRVNLNVGFFQIFG